MNTDNTDKKIKYDDICRLFASGIDCSQVVTGCFAAEAGIDEETARKMSSCFGAGMMSGETCGAVTGALMVIGMKYGHFREGDLETKARAAAKSAEFRRLFTEKYHSCMCRELLGHDVSKPGELEKAVEEGLLTDFCPHVVEDAVEILEQVLQDETR